MRRDSFCAVAFTLLIFPLLTVHGLIIKNETKICNSKECVAAAKDLKDSMDMKAKPCDDFYQYACGRWPKTHKNLLYPLPTSSVSLRNDQNDEEILEYLKQKDDKNELEAIYKARQLYSLCMNRSSYDGVDQMKHIFSEIDVPYLSFKTPKNSNFDYVSAIAKTMRLAGIKMFFDTSVEANPYNHSENAIWLSKPMIEYDTNVMPLINNHKMLKRRESSLDENEFLKKAVKEICGTEYPLHCRVNNVTLVTNILEQNHDRTVIMAKARTKLNLSFLPTVYTLEEFQKLSDNIADEEKTSIPKLNWTRYMEVVFSDLENVTLDLRDTSKVQIVVHEIDYIQDMIRFIYKRNIKELELGLWWKLVSTLLPYANYNIFKARTKVELPIITSEKRCTKIVTSSFGMALSYMYMKKDQNNKIKTEIEEMLQHIKESYKKIFEEAPWMDQQTREKSMKKLAAMKSLIAYPNSNELAPILSEEYGDVKIGDNFLASMITKIQDQIKRNLKRLNKINEPTKANWLLPPTIVNAFYIMLDNSMTIPAALLGAPIHYKDNLKALLYGALGSVVGHELSHGFDETGRRYNDKGELEEWWENDTLVKFNEKSSCFLKAYDNYNTTFEGFNQKVDSNLTLTEDISDSGGFREGLYAYRSYVSKNGKEPALVNFDKFTHEQLLTLGFANFWCESPTLVSPFLAPFMDHSPNAVRVNGVLKNSKEFAEIWNCPEGSNMNPAEKCSLW